MLLATLQGVVKPEEDNHIEFTETVRGGSPSTCTRRITRHIDRTRHIIFHCALFFAARRYEGSPSRCTRRPHSGSVSSADPAQAQPLAARSQSGSAGRLISRALTAVMSPTRYFFKSVIIGFRVVWGVGRSEAFCSGGLALGRWLSQGVGAGRRGTA